MHRGSSDCRTNMSMEAVRRTRRRRRRGQRRQRRRRRSDHALLSACRIHRAGAGSAPTAPASLQVCSVIHPKQHKETKNRSARPSLLRRRIQSARSSSQPGASSSAVTAARHSTQIHSALSHRLSRRRSPVNQQASNQRGDTAAAAAQGRVVSTRRPPAGLVLISTAQLDTALHHPPCYCSLLPAAACCCRLACGSLSAFPPVCLPEGGTFPHHLTNAQLARGSR